MSSEKHFPNHDMGDLGELHLARWNFEKVLEAGLRYFQNTVNVFYVLFHMSNQILS